MQRLAGRRRKLIPGRSYGALAALLAVICPWHHFASAASPGINTLPGESDLQIAVQSVTGLDLQSNMTTGGVDTTATGNFTAAGTITVGSVAAQPNAACTMVGAIRYNTTSSIFEGCNGTTWTPLAGSSGWVNVPQLSDGATFAQIGGGPVVMYYPSSPTQWCQSHGYTSATGACKGTAGYSTPSMMDGVLAVSIYPTPDNAGLAPYNTWHWACQWGGASNQFFINTDTQILCVK